MGPLVFKNPGSTFTTTVTSAPTANQTLALPNATDTIAIVAGVQTLTNKTLTGTTNTIRATQFATTGADVLFSAAPPVAGQYLVAATATTAGWITPYTNLGGYVFLNETETVATNGGTNTPKQWITRVLNTTVNAQPWCSLNTTTYQFTLAAGTYYIDSMAPVCSVDSHRTRLQNVTAGTFIAYSPSDNTTSTATTNNTGMSRIMYAFSITGSTVFSIDHWTLTKNSNTGFGFASGIPGLPEVFTQLLIQKVS